MGFLAPQTRPKKGTDRQDTGPGNRQPPIYGPGASVGLSPVFGESIEDPNVLRDPQESISETRERMSGPRIADKNRPWLGNTSVASLGDGGD